MRTSDLAQNQILKALLVFVGILMMFTACDQSQKGVDKLEKKVEQIGQFLMGEEIKEISVPKKSVINFLIVLFKLAIDTFLSTKSPSI